MPRTVEQFRLTATGYLTRSWVDAHISKSARIASYLAPIPGVVVTIGPNNFPFAFNGVAGGDFAAAIATGHPVLAKANRGHPKPHVYWRISPWKRPPLRAYRMPPFSSLRESPSRRSAVGGRSPRGGNSLHGVQNFGPGPQESRRCRRTPRTWKCRALIRCYSLLGHWSAAVGIRERPCCEHGEWKRSILHRPPAFSSCRTGRAALVFVNPSPLLSTTRSQGHSRTRGPSRTRTGGDDVGGGWRRRWRFVRREAASESHYPTSMLTVPGHQFLLRHDDLQTGGAASATPHWSSPTRMLRNSARACACLREV